MNNMHGTTIFGVRKNGSVTIAVDGQVSLGNTIIKGTAQKKLNNLENYPSKNQLRVNLMEDKLFKVKVK